MALAIMAGLLLLPRAGQASCGDYVLVGQQGKQAASDAKATAPMDPGMMPGHLPEKKAPCSGPNCGRAPERPLPVPISVGPTSGEQWVWAGCSPHFAENNASPHPCDRLPVRPSHRHTPVEHPPRLFPVC
jgi:hypothetical protein